MKNKNFLYIGIGIAVVAIAIPLSFLMGETEPPIDNMSELDISYEETNVKLKQSLAPLGVSMSSPINLINQNKINEFCSFFSDEIKQKQVDFCTSTELVDSEGGYLGNIHMVGSKNSPKIVLAIIQSNPFWNNLDQVKLIFDTVVDDLVCDCWEDFMPSGFETVSVWVDEQKKFHTDGNPQNRPTSTSSMELMEKRLQMELSTNMDGYLWKLLISN